MTAPASARDAAARRHNLPAEVASFVGREREVAEIEEILQRTRLLTLTGAGGCGKTRLALRVAADLLQRFPDGVWLVQFATVSDSSLVGRTVAAALGVHGSSGRPLLATLAAALAPRRLLLVLDNCEHLIGGCARLADTLLRACPNLRILATSREPLRIPGEFTWRVPSLRLPAAGHPASPDSLAGIEAVALFVDRARARQPGFMLTQSNASSVSTICGKLDGLPLAIELAAARMGALAPEQIAAQLDDALRLLGGGSRTLPRHETLRAALDWSHALLSEAERLLLRRLAVFAGGFSVAAAEGVCSGEGIEPAEILAVLMALVDKSLVEPQVQPHGARYRLLEPVRQYALALLTAHGEADTLNRRHALHFLAVAETAEPALMSGQRRVWIARLAADQDNLRAALAWSHRAATAHGDAVGLRLVGALFWFWGLLGEVSEGAEWTEAALAQQVEAAPVARAKALHTAGELAWLQGRDPAARASLAASAELWRALGDRRELAYVLQALALVVEPPNDVAAATESLRLFEEVGDAWGAAHAFMSLGMLALGRGAADAEQRLEDALARWRALGDGWGAAQTLNFLGDLSRGLGEDARARARYEESLALLHEEGLPGTVPSLLHNLGYLALRGGNPRRALRLFQESLALFQGQGDQRGVAECLAGLAGAFGGLKQPEQAARLFGTAEVLRGATGATTWPINAADYARSVAATSDQLAETAFSAAWAEGRALPLEQAIVQAMAEDLHPRGANPSVGTGWPGLTAREHEVVALIAHGMTNRQIGTRLVITEGTARLHVKHVLHKLGFTSRAQVAGWGVAQGLGLAPRTNQEPS